MGRDAALAILRARQDALQALGVRSLALFGSMSRDEAGPESDVDLLVSFSRPVGLVAFIQTKHFLEEALGRPVDLVTVEALRQEMREQVLREAIDAA